MHGSKEPANKYLAGDGLDNQRTWQLPSYVRFVPTGKETGRFLAIDLGGSNCRICLVDLHGDATFTVVRSKYTVPVEDRVNASYRPVFSFIAEKIADFLDVHLNSNASDHDHQKPYQLGFTFSFNCEQTSLSRGTLIRWDKGWDIPDAVGRDPCAMLQEAIDSLDLPVHVSVLANDSVGTLLTRSYSSGQGGSTLAAVIFGTGTNAAYVEKVSNIRRTTTKTQEEPGDIMVINTEWGCFDDDKLEVLPMTRYDHDLDAGSIDPGSQVFEKLVSGMYLGELLRLVIVQLLNENVLNMHISQDSVVFRKGGLDSSFLSQLAGADCSCPEAARMVITKTLAAENACLSDVRSIQTLAGAIARRAARLAGASLAAIIIQSGRLETARPGNEQSQVRVEDYQPRLQPHRPLSIEGFLGFCKPLGLLLRKVLAFFGMSSFLAMPASRGSPRLVSSAVDDIPEEDIIDIGADGSLIEFYPTFEADMRAAMREIPEISSSGEKRIRIGLAKDGSGVGAALMAQAALQGES